VNKLAAAGFKTVEVFTPQVKKYNGRFDLPTQTAKDKNRMVTYP